MKRCPECNRIYTDDTQVFCLSDGTILTAMPENASVVPAVPAVDFDLPVAPPVPAAQPAVPAMPNVPVLPAVPNLPAAPPPSAPPAAAFVPNAAPTLPPNAPAAQQSTKASPLVLGGVVLAIIVIGGGYRVLTTKKTDPAPIRTPATAPSQERPADSPSQPAAAPPDTPSANPGTQPDTPPAGSAPVDEATLKDAIRLADEAEVQAMSTLDPTPLYQTYAGEALQSELKKVQDLKAKNLVVAAHLDSQEIQAFKVSTDGSRAAVQITETWTTQVYSIADKKMVENTPSKREPQVISLVRGKNGWLVYSDVPQ